MHCATDDLRWQLRRRDERQVELRRMRPVVRRRDLRERSLRVRIGSDFMHDLHRTRHLHVWTHLGQRQLRNLRTRLRRGRDLHCERL